MRLYFLLLLTLSALLSAQVPVAPATLQLPPALTAAGSAVAVNGESWGYVVWNATDPKWHETHDIAVFLKAGAANSVAPFELQGTISPLTDPTPLTTWISRAQKLADATSGLAEQLNICSQNATTLIRQWSPVPNPTIPGPLAEKLAMLGTRAAQDPGSAAAIRGLGNSHPVFRFLAGTGWAGPLNVPLGQDATIELREILRATGQQKNTVGRVTLRATAPGDLRVSPDIINAPGSPVQVPPQWLTTLPALETSINFPPPTALPDLAPALRWQIPTALRRQILQCRGFMAWRTNTATNYAAIPNLLSANPTKILRNPAPASKIFSNGSDPGPLVSNFTLDPTTFFIADDRGRYDFTTAPAPGEDPVFPNPPHTANSLQYYHLAATDLLGRYGPPSPAGQARVIHTLPPNVPSITQVDNVMSAGSPRLRLLIRPNQNLPGEIPTNRYLIFRDRAVNTSPPNSPPTALLNKAIDPALQNQLVYIGTINQPLVPNQDLIFVDQALNPTQPAHFGQTYFYSVRAVHDTTLGLNPSPTSPPVFGTLRDRTGSAPPTALTHSELPRPGIALHPTTAFTPSALPKAPNEVRNVRLRFDRLDPGISHLKVEMTGRLAGTDGVPTAEATRQFPDLHFGNGNTITYNFTVPNNRTESFSLRIRPVSTQNRLGHTFEFSTQIESLDPQTLHTFHFQTATRDLIHIFPVTDGGLFYDPWHAYFYSNVTPTSQSFTPVSSADGTFSGVFSGAPSLTPRSLLIQRRSGTGPWENVATSLLQSYATTFYFRLTTTAEAPTYRVWLVRDPSDNPIPPIALHKPAVQKQPVPIKLLLNIPVGAHEYRIYRRIDGGPLFLLKQDTGTWDVAALKTTVFDDGLIPPTGTDISYFGQTFDENGNPSPMVLLDQKIGLIPELPIPLVDALEPGGATADPLMLVRASCPSPGVRRFEIKMTPSPQATTTLLSQAKPSGLLINFNPGDAPTLPQDFSTSHLTDSWLDLPADQPLIYTNSIRVLANTEYTFQIRTLGDYENVGQWSAEQKFIWTPPLVAEDVPWPSRPLPKVESWNPRLSAFAPTPLQFHLSQNPAANIRPQFHLSFQGGVISTFPTTSNGFYPDHPKESLPVAIQIGAIILRDPDPFAPNANWSVYGATQFINNTQGMPTAYNYGNLGVDDIPGYEAPTGPDNLFHQFLFQKTAQQGDIPTYDYTRTLFPFVIYRQQTHRGLGNGVSVPVTNADVVQVTPMIESIAWRTEANTHAVLVDPYVRAVRRVPFTDSPEIALCVFDTAPAAWGATYNYTLVHFSPEGEPDLLHPCGSVTIPYP